jgi:site-specific DNA-methyltransferase (adenine-specific)
MRYLCRLVTPPGGVILDPFAGSGSTGKAAILEGFRCILIERDEESCAIAAARCRHAAEIAARRMRQEVLPLFDNSSPRA